MTLVVSGVRWVLVYTTSVAVLGVGLSLLLVDSYRMFGVALAVLLNLALARPVAAVAAAALAGLALAPALFPRR